MTQPLRIGVLGLTHDHVWENLDQLVDCIAGQLVAVADPHPPLLARARELYNCPAYDSPTALLDGEQLDAVFLFSDNAACVELAQLAARRGLHIMVEKPLANSLAGAERMTAAAEGAGVRLMVNWPFAWWPQMQQAIATAAGGAVGRIWQVRYRAAHAGPRQLGCSDYFCEWLFDPRRNGAALMDYCCYGAILARVLLGMPRRVTAVCDRLCKDDLEVEDNAVVVMSYDDALGMAEASWTQVGKLTSYLTAIYGTTGTLLVEPRSGGRLLLADVEHPDGIEVAVPAPPPHLASASAHFTHQVANDQPFFDLCQHSGCRDVQEILEAGLQSARSGREVRLPLADGEQT